MQNVSTKPQAETQVAELPDTIAGIAAIIEKDWKNVHFSARAYLTAMHSLRTASDGYGDDTAGSIVQYFLGNARSWTGPLAKACKAKLKQLIA